jgi:metallo-beta-lactamase class B
MTKHILTGYAVLGILLISCADTVKQKTVAYKNDGALTESSVIYASEKLIIQKLSEHSYRHISYLNTNDFGKVASNGMIVVNETEAVVFDTPSDNESSDELINYVTNNLNGRIKAVIPTHFHKDCAGGLEKFIEKGIPAFATDKTVALLKNEGHVFEKPIIGFIDTLTLTIGDKKVYAQYFGEGHSKDNIIGYFPHDNALFGGCLIKTIGANKGFLGDANIDDWSGTVAKLKQKYPTAKIVIPGHGKWGGTELFDYTINLFK